MFIDFTIDLLKSLKNTLTGGSPPPSSSGSSSSDVPPECQSIRGGLDKDEATINQVTSTVDTLVRKFPDTIPILDSGRITKVKSFQPQNWRIDGKTTLDPVTNMFEVGINIRNSRNEFDVGAKLLHELYHVKQGIDHGFLPPLVASELTFAEYKILVWQFELKCFQFELEGMNAIVDTDGAYDICRAIVKADNEVIAQLNRDSLSGAKREIKAIYNMTSLESEYNEARSTPATPTFKQHLTTFRNNNLFPASGDWGL